MSGSEAPNTTSAAAKCADPASSPGTRANTPTSRFMLVPPYGFCEEAMSRLHVHSVVSRPLFTGLFSLFSFIPAASATVSISAEKSFSR